MDKRTGVVVLCGRLIISGGILHDVMGIERSVVMEAVKFLWVCVGVWEVLGLPV